MRPLIAILITLFAALSACSDDTSGSGDGGDAGADLTRDRGTDDTDTPSGPACEGDDDCRTGTVCDPTLGRCVPACLSDADCDAAESCETASGLCRPRPSCAAASECTEDEACDSCLGVCVPSEGGATCLEDVNCPDFDQFCDICINECRRALTFCEPCREDRECGEAGDFCLTYADGGQYCGGACGEGRPCPRGATCSPEQGQCVPLTGSCAELSECDDDEDCSGRQICSSQGICFDGCTTDGACPETDVCSAGRCVPPCASEADCEPGEECDETGHCRIPGSCITSWDCPEAEMHCDRTTGMCAPGCEVDDDCRTASLICRDGDCVDAPCRGAYACAFGQICDFDTGECRVPDEDYCGTCDGDDTESCGPGNLCANLQDGEGNDQGAFCWIACSDDPLNRCPRGYNCQEIDVPTSGGGSETRVLCARACYANPI